MVLENKNRIIASGGGGFCNFISNYFINKVDIEPYMIRFNGASFFKYDFLMALDERDYPKYLSYAYMCKLGRKLNLKFPKTINEKIQWLKLYDNIPLKSQLSDKVLVRDWVSDKIGANVLKPVLSVCNSFDEISFKLLPNSFVIKANHACSWNIFVKDKENFVNNSKLMSMSEEMVDGWMSQCYFGWSDFETQYRYIQPKIIVEELLKEYSGNSIIEFEIWVFNSKPLIFEQKYIDPISHKKMTSVFNVDYENIDLKFIPDSVVNLSFKPHKLLKHAVEYSKVLGKDFKLVRIDWIVCRDKLYFNEMTFTPLSGYILFSKRYQDWYLKLGNMLKLK